MGLAFMQPHCRARGMKCPGRASTLHLSGPANLRLGRRGSIGGRPVWAGKNPPPPWQIRTCRMLGVHVRASPTGGGLWTKSGNEGRDFIVPRGVKVITLSRVPARAGSAVSPANITFCSRTRWEQPICGFGFGGRGINPYPCRQLIRWHGTQTRSERRAPSSRQGRWFPTHG